jgi:hypothetical protein
VGNLPATSVHIQDQLPEGLDMATFRILSQSHDGMAMQADGHNITFSWSDIYLSDSVTDAKRSEGYIVFTIQPKSGIQPGTMLYNKAYITFDNNDPIETNTVLNTIQSKEQEDQLIQVIAYPNPASDVLYFSLKHVMGNYTAKEIKTAELLDSYGRIITSKSFAAKQELRLDLPRVLSGYYWLRITDTQMHTYMKKILVMKDM